MLRGVFVLAVGCHVPTRLAPTSAARITVNLDIMNAQRSIQGMQLVVRRVLAAVAL